MDDRIKGRRINVTTNSGVVTLNGEIADDTERAEALLLARTTEGVKRVEDNLTISPAPATTTQPPGHRTRHRQRLRPRRPSRRWQGLMPTLR